MKIRKFKQEDSERCNRIIYNCIEISKKTTKQDRNKLKQIYTIEKIKDYSKISDFYIVEHNKKIIGMGRVEKNKIATIYFDPKFHGKGGGRLIIRKLENLAKKRKMKRVYLEALLQAVGFYEKQCFKKIKKLTKPINSMKMEKRLL